MKVLFHCYEFPPQAGGVGSYISNMAHALQSIGHQSVVVTSRSPGLPEEEVCGGSLVYRIYDRSEMYSRRVSDAVLAISRQHQVDVIEGADHYGEVSAILSSRNRPPVLVKVHGSNPIKVVQDAQVIWNWQRGMILMAHLRQWRQTLHERRSIEKADMVLSPSRRMLDELRRQGFSLPKDTTDLPNPAPVWKPYDQQESLRPLLLLPARLEIRKGVEFLPGLLRRLVDRFPELALEIAGSDCYARGLGSTQSWLCGRLGEVMSHVRFLGVLHGPDLDAAYARAWVVILPSRWDNFPTVLLEAMVRGKPVVSSSCGGMPEMLAGTECLAVPPDSNAFSDEVGRLLSDRRWRLQAGASLQAKAARAYAPEVVARQYVQFVTQCLGK